MRTIIVWADYTWTDAEDFDYEKDWSWMSDDYMEIEVPESLDDDEIEQWLKDREKRPKQYLYCNHRLIATVISLDHAIDHMFENEEMMDVLQFELQDDGTRCMITPWLEDSMEVTYLLSDTGNLGHIGEGN